MGHSFWPLAVPLYLAWVGLGRLSHPTSAGRVVYLGVVLGTVGLLLPLPWLALHRWLPALPALYLTLWLVLLLSCGVYPLLAWLLQRYPVSKLRRWLLWTADAGVLAWLLL